MVNAATGSVSSYQPRYGTRAKCLTRSALNHDRDWFVFHLCIVKNPGIQHPHVHQNCVNGARAGVFQQDEPHFKTARMQVLQCSSIELLAHHRRCPIYHPCSVQSAPEHYSKADGWRHGNITYCQVKFPAIAHTL